MPFEESSSFPELFEAMELEPSRGLEWVVGGEKQRFLVGLGGGSWVVDSSLRMGCEVFLTPKTLG